MNDIAHLKNHFLIAMPGLADPNFAHTVTYVCEHNRDGAMGIVINRPTDLSLGEVFEHLGIESGVKTDVAAPVFEGGPMQREHGFILHSPAGSWDSSLAVTESIAITTSRDILEAIAAGDGPTKTLFALGYAGWGAGQLEEEMAANAWLSGPAEPHILFDLAVEQRWLAAAALLGVDLNLLSSDVGHA